MVLGTGRAQSCLVRLCSMPPWADLPTYPSPVCLQRGAECLGLELPPVGSAAAGPEVSACKGVSFPINGLYLQTLGVFPNYTFILPVEAYQGKRGTNVCLHTRMPKCTSCTNMGIFPILFCFLLVFLGVTHRFYSGCPGSFTAYSGAFFHRGEHKTSCKFS